MPNRIPSAQHPSLDHALAYNFGVTAIVLIRLDARPTEWVNVTDLAEHLACCPEVLCQHLEGMVADGLVAAVRSRAMGTDGRILQVRAMPPEAWH